MKRFLKYIALFVLPIGIVLLPFVMTDPFMVLRNYNRYYPENGTPLYINNNRSYVCTRMYLQQKDSLKYNSFIFGSSRSGYYLAKDWKKYLPDDASIFHFDGYGESLYLIHKKINFVDGKSSLDNVLIPIDAEALLQVEMDRSHIVVTPPELNPSTAKDFYLSNLRAYLNPKFLVAYNDFIVTKTIRPDMIEWGVIDTMPNYEVFDVNERNIPISGLVYPDEYYTPTRLEAMQNARSGEVTNYEPMIKEKQKMMLEEIHDVLVRNKSNYRIIINPCYDQKRYAEEDIQYLKQLFGENFYDFSGVTVYSQDYHNYHDPAHFSDRVAADIMSIIYDSDKERQTQRIDSIYNVQ